MSPDSGCKDTEQGRASVQLGFLFDYGARRYWIQGLFLAFVFAGVAWMCLHAVDNMDRRGLSLGFGFLSQRANFAIGESLVEFSPSDSFARALLVGAINTVWVAWWGCLLTTIVGVIIGLARLSSNRLLARLSALYVELGRNVPVLLQLLFWYSLISNLGGPRSALELLPGVFLSNRGLQFPSFTLEGPLYGPVVGLGAAGLVSWGLILSIRKHSSSDASHRHLGWFCGLALGGVLLGGYLGGNAFAVAIPELKGFNFTGGTTITVEFTALLVGLTFYTGAFVAEIVRGGIVAVSPGQWEAGRAIGLSNYRTFKTIIFPQVMRTILPPLTSQYINLTKNSSIAVAIGYPDLINVANTTINQTGQAVQVVVIFMAIYLGLSLTISALTNWYNRFIKRRGG